jgi:hypothetical protein
MRLSRFAHRPGFHCGSTALSDALRARGLDLSEAMVFGLGAGLGFYYLVGESLSPTRMFHGRFGPLEETACEVLGAPMVQRTEEDAGRAEAGVKEALARGFAPVLSCDIRYLPYYRTQTAFNGHRICLAGWDEEKNAALVADTEREGLLEVPAAELDRSRASDGPPVGYTARWWAEVDAPARPRPLAETAADAIRRLAKHMLEDSQDFIGQQAMDRWAAEVGGWHEACRDEADRVWTFRFGYQVIEKRGTGGGLFRRLYARFLAEVSEALPAIARAGAAERMTGIADGWTKLALAMKEAAETPKAPLSPEGVALARRLCADERRFYEDAAALLR